MIRVRSYFVYRVPVVTLAAGDSESSTVRIESATDFYWIKGSFFADDNAAPGGQTESNRIIPSVDVQIEASGSDRNLFDGAVPIPSVFGDGRLPDVLPFAMTLLANSEVRFNFTSREDTRELQIRLALHGWKDYGELEADPDR